jgi:hypothetical protein
MTPEEAAAQLDGTEYDFKFSSGQPFKELYAKMKAEGLVAVFGESDDLVEFRGAIHDELGAFNGTTAYLTDDGLVQNDCSADDCPHFERKKETARIIDALWCDEDEASWTFKTTIPHVTFNIVENGTVFCRGIVFRLVDAAKVPS